MHYTENLGNTGNDNLVKKRKVMIMAYYAIYYRLFRFVPIRKTYRCRKL